jgi:Protein of unknown function (DUF3631)
MAKLTAEQRFLKLVLSLHGMLGSDNVQERQTADAKLRKILEDHKKTWNDIPELLVAASKIGGSAVDPFSDADDDDNDVRNSGGLPGEAREPADALKAVHLTIEKYCDVKPHESIAAALYILHTFVFNSFSISPRLALTSPTNGCGKTTLLDIIKALAYRAQRTDNCTAAAVYHIINKHRGTLLVDEADNLGLNDSAKTMRAVFNSGHRRGGNITRVINGELTEFSTFAPMAIASINILPMPLMRRSVVIHMERTARRDLARFDMMDPDTQRIINAVYRLILEWVRSNPTLNLDPKLPSVLRNRAADNWRVLIAIADCFGEEWGKSARDAAIRFATGYHDEEASVILLSDLRDIFNRSTADRASSEYLIEQLHDLDSMWLEYRGIRDDQPPRKLTAAEMARLLKPFGIKPRSIWPLGSGRAGRKQAGSRKGYFRQQFEQAWARYCQQDGTPAHFGKIKHLADK